MSRLTATSLFSFTLISAVILIVSAPKAKADELDFLFNLGAQYLLHEQDLQLAQYDRRSRRHGAENGYRESRRNRNGFARSDRRDNGSHSYTSEPIRGGSSRRTRIVDNPYSNRIVTGITLTGIDNDIVHIKDVISYPHRRKISRRGISLSAYHPSRYTDTRSYVDYISIQAKRKEYFTVTFHYD